MSHAAFFGDQQAIADWVVELMDRGLSDEEIWQDVTGIAGVLRFGHPVTGTDLLAVMRGMLAFQQPNQPAVPVA